MMKSCRARDRKGLVLAIAIALGVPASAARADELQDLRAQVEALLKRVAELEQKQDKTDQNRSAAPPSNVVTGGATPGSFKLPGSNT